MHASVVRLEMHDHSSTQLSCTLCGQYSSAVQCGPSPICRHMRDDAALAWLGRSHAKHAQTKLPLIRWPCITFLHRFLLLFVWRVRRTFSSPDGVFLPCDYGLDFLQNSLLCDNSINQCSSGQSGSAGSLLFRVITGEARGFWREGEDADSTRKTNGSKPNFSHVTVETPDN